MAKIPDKFRVGGLYFDCPVGVHRDLNELEYIAALLQSHPKIVRTSGTLKAIDIVIYLLSRHGVQVSKETVEDLIVTELAGNTMKETATNTSRSSSDNNYAVEITKVLDISQMAAILVIPELLQAARKSESCASSDSTHLFSAFEAELGGALPTTKEALRKAMKDNGVVVDDDEIPEDLLDSMLAAAKGGTIDALTSDLELFSLEWKCSHSTIFEDISAVATECPPVEVSRMGTDGQQEQAPIDQIVRINTAPSLDATADTVRRPLAFMLLWSSGIVAYFAYVLNTKNEGEWLDANCEGDATACTIADGILRWLAVFLQLVLLGLPFMWLGSLGNSVYVDATWKSILKTCISITTVAMFTVVPFFKVNITYY